MAAVFVFCVSILFSLNSLCSSQSDMQNGTGIYLINNSDAVCLDGTPGLFYISEGTENNKFVLFFEGGGVCSGLSQSPEPSCFDTCYSRSKKGMGSTKADRPWLNMNVGISPLVSNNKTENPLMADWNHIFIRYCDGGFYAGNKTEPDTYNNTKIYYRGAVILHEIIEHLINNYKLTEATDIVISGCSAGAQAVYININKIYKWMGINSQKVNVYTIADSGFIMDYNGVNNDTQMSVGQGVAYHEHHMEGSVPTECLQYMDNNQMDHYHCIFPQYNSKYINENVNFFALQSQYDAFQINCVLGSNDRTLIQDFGMNLENMLNESLLLNKPNHGAMIDSCQHHCGGWNTIELNGVTQCDAFTDFYNNKQKQRIWYQNQTFPCDSCCNGL